jgi:hypothetical protein
MKSLSLAGAMIIVTVAICRADGLYWVVGNRATNSCDIVTRNPVIDGLVGGNTWFGSGPYKSLDDARLARSTINACPKEDPATRAADEGRPG